MSHVVGYLLDEMEQINIIIKKSYDGPKKVGLYFVRWGIEMNLAHLKYLKYQKCIKDLAKKKKDNFR